MRYSPTDIETKLEMHELGYLVTISFTINYYHEVRIRSIGTYITLHVDGREIMNTTAKMLKAQEFHYTIEEVQVDFNLTITAGVVGALPSLSVGGVMVYNPFV